MKLEKQSSPFRIMGLYDIKFSFILVLSISLFRALSASAFISDAVFGSSVLSERRLLQIKKPCPVDFEHQNYTIITSKCKGPNYPPDLCCSALKDFACPFAKELNDISNNCATIMFSYITPIGRYPPSLFASNCREGIQGLACPALPPSPPSASQSESLLSKRKVHIISELIILILMLTAASLGFLMHII